MTLRPLSLTGLLLLAGTASADLYTCVDAQGHKTMSDQACPATQNTAKVYLAPPKPVPPPTMTPDAPMPDAQLTEALKALLQAHEREAAESNAPPGSAETDAQRHMRIYLEQKQAEAPKQR
jgi:hypothetical protein